MKTGGQIPKITRIDGDVLVETGQGRLWGFLVVGGSAKTVIAFHDALSAAGDSIMDGVSAIDTVSPFVDFIDMGGIPFSTGLWANITTTGGFVYAFTTDKL
jgi:hypothetical protein